MRGVYLVAAELARQGFIVSPTSRSAAGADLLVTNQDCSKAFSVQVKTNAASFSFFLLGKHARKIKARSHIYILVNIKSKETEFYVVPSTFIAIAAKKGRKTRKWDAGYFLRRDKLGKFRDRWKAFGDPIGTNAS